MKRITLVLLILILCFSGNAFAQWQQISGLYGEPVYMVRSTPTQLYAMTLEGVLKSSNDGASWVKVPELYLTNVIERMSASGNMAAMFAIPDNYISTDDGQTWNEVIPPSASVFSSDIIVDNGKVYLPTYGDYLYTSSNGGTTWNQTTQGLTTSELNCLHAEGSNVFVGTDDGVFVSVNAGASFTFSGLAGEYITRIYNKGNYAFAFGSGVFRSDDNGATWNPFEPVIPYGDVTDFLLDGNFIYAATGGELIRSNVFLPNWLPINFTQDIAYNYSIIKKGGKLFAGSNRGVFVSTDSGASWSESNTGIVPISIRGLSLLGNDTVMAGASIYGISRYNGTTWDYSGIPLLNSNDLITHNGDVYSASEFGIHKSSDGGVTWDLLNNTNPPVISYCSEVAVSDSLVIGAALQNGILRSGDFGVSWTIENTGITPSLASTVAVIGTNIVAGTYDNGLYTSTDAGFTWTQTAASGELINDLTVIGNVIIAATSGPSGTYRSADMGLTWTAVQSDYFDNLSTSGPYVVASGPGYVQLSVDMGLSYAFNTPSPTGSFISSSIASSNEVFIGTYYDGVWKTTFFDITSIPTVENIKYSAKIFPNVFHSSANLVIDEKLLEFNPELIITDINGKTVLTKKISNQRSVVNADNLNSGIYFYRVISSKYETKAGKLVIY